MTPRPDGFVDYDDLPPERQAEARAVIGRLSTLTPDDAPLFAFRITRGWQPTWAQGVPAGIVSASRKDLRPSRSSEGRAA